MQTRPLPLICLLAFCLVPGAPAGEPERIGHATFLPRHSSPDDKGLYTAFIDTTNGYAYFAGNYLTKLDITVDPPQRIGAALQTGQFVNNAVDLANLNAYFARGSLYRYSLGLGTNPVTANGSLALAAGSAQSVVIDDSDPNATNHYAFVLCLVPGAPAKVAKVALSTFTELNSIPLAPGETNFLLGSLVDPQNHYAYFVTAPSSAAPVVVKIKMTSGTNPPVRIGAASLGTAGEFIDGASIDTVHGYAYYGSYNSDTNVTGKVYKVKLEDGDVPPTFVGYTSLRAGEGRLAASILDPQSQFVYFGNDNSYPGGLYQLSLNGTNPPIEVGFLPFPGGPSNPPPSGITADNTTTNADGVLPFGEVFFRSAVFDNLRGFAYFGQDSRPNQIVKIKVAAVDRFTISEGQPLPSGALQFAFSNISGGAFTVLAASNPAVSLSNWNALTNAVMETAPGQYQFMDSFEGKAPSLFYRVSSP